MIANFKKDGEKGTSQRSRPSTARSTASSRQNLSASFVSLNPPYCHLVIGVF